VRHSLHAVFMISFSAASLCPISPGHSQVVEKPEATFPVRIRVDASQTMGQMNQAWRFFGHDEPNYTYMNDGRKLLSQLARLGSQPTYIRTHNLLTSGDGTPALKWGSTGVYAEDRGGKPRYDWSILDRIFDTYREAGVRPYVQIGFMPEALSTHPTPYQHRWTPGGHESISTGWAYPPRDYARWAELVYRWVQHSVERYGKDEVETWYWEVWNEPNILYWRGTPEEYRKLYDYSADAVKRALPTARVGGPHVAGTRSAQSSQFLREFLNHCLYGSNYATGKKGAPLDFVAFHAKGEPRYVDGHVRMGIGPQIQDIDRGFEIVASYPELKGSPIIIGESDPDGCAACPATVYPQNGYRNGTLYASYTAAVFARTLKLARDRGVNLEGNVTWAFEFENQPYFAGFRALSTRGISLPILNLFRMLGMMEGSRVVVESDGELPLEEIRRSGARERPDVSAIASLSHGRLCVLLWHHHDIDRPGPSGNIELSISGLPGGTGSYLLEHFRIDQHHSNAFEVWKRMGAPQNPTQAQTVELEKSARLEIIDSPSWIRAVDGQWQSHVALPRQAISLLIFTPSQGSR
jgi:xylan 1,4-beta-xylosidase